MKINLYNDWEDTPAAPNRPFKTKGQPLLLLDTKRHSPRKIIARMAFRYSGNQSESGNILVTVTDKNGYDNCLVGNSDQIAEFVKDCLYDEGYLPKERGHRV